MGQDSSWRIALLSLKCNPGNESLVRKCAASMDWSSYGSSKGSARGSEENRSSLSSFEERSLPADSSELVSNPSTSGSPFPAGECSLLKP